MTYEECIAYVSAGIEIFAALVTIILLLGCITEPNTQNKRNKYYKSLLVCNIIMLISDALIWILIDIPKYVILMKPLYFVSYVFGVIMMCLYMLFAIHIVSEKEKTYKYIRHFAVAYSIFISLLWTISLFNGMYFYFDSEGFFHYTSLYWISQLFGIIFLLWITIYIFIHRKGLGARLTLVLISYGVLPIISIPLEIFWEVTPLYMASTLSLLLYYTVIHINQNLKISQQQKDLLAKELELIDIKTKIIISQMQPHFLYNSLTAIKNLCKTNPKEAAETVAEFSFYLRNNMDAMSTNNCITFNKEMEHIKSYLFLEKKRFGERLKVEYDIKEALFMLPPLTVQPLIENSVKYGVSNRLEGCTIKLSTYSDTQNYYIEIVDNGIGFNTTNYKTDNKTHIGIDGVRTRLRVMCNGQLELESIANQGTKAKITIPKQ